MSRGIITLFLLFFSIESCENKHILSGNKIEINNTIENDNNIVDFIFHFFLLMFAPNLFNLLSILLYPLSI